MNAQQFEEYYASNTGITVEELRKLGMYVSACDCKEEDCVGWKMDSQENKLKIVDLPCVECDLGRV